MSTNQPTRATVYLYNGAESLEMRLTELTADQLSLLYQLAESTGATGLAALAFELTSQAVSPEDLADLQEQTGNPEPTTLTGADWARHNLK